MPHIFRFHAGRNNNIFDWKASDKIVSADVSEVQDKTNELTSSAGTSIPTPIARMFLFKTAFEIVAKQVRDSKKEFDYKSIYAGLVSETLDLLELLYKNGSDEKKYRYQKWVFDNSQKDDNVILNFFGQQHGHRLLAESFKQAASQAPFNNKIEITLIYLIEGNKEILLGGTSTFSFVFTTPNFKRKMRDRGFRPIPGLVSNDILFDNDYKQLHERDESFIKYVESLKDTQGINDSFKGFADYVTNTKKRFENKFNGKIASLQDIQFGDAPVSVSNIHLKQISEEDYKLKINQDSDFKIELPEGTSYNDPLNPLFLLDKMTFDGQYTSPSNHWSATTKISENEYYETTLDHIKARELPGEAGINYPFFSSFDFFERCLIKLPGYALNDERFLTLADNQTFIFPIKPIFFNLFPIDKIKKYINVESKNDQVTFIIKVPIFGPTKGKRELICRKTYDADSIINYSGILGIFPFTKATEKNLLYINKYTIASYEKTNVPILLESIKFFKNTQVPPVKAMPSPRSNYADINTKTTYFKIEESSFDIIQLNFQKDNSSCGGIIIPKFKEVENGTEEYVYAIDFGTSNTHIEFSIVLDGAATNTEPFEITEENMIMTLLNKPVVIKENDGAIQYNDYERRSMGAIIDSARQITLREFVPFQFGSHPGATFKFPFRTSTFESRGFKDSKQPSLFVDVNIGFNIDNDTLDDSQNYQTDIKWQLESKLNDDLKQNRVKLFFRQLLLMIRTHALLHENTSCNLDKLKVAISYPTSMDKDLKEYLIDSFNKQMKDVFNIQKEEDIKNKVIEVTESIAPYYHLLKQDSNIQHDTYCNIDIGGGTTDIVLVKKDITILNCYCTSVKFAGKQLWGSASDDYDPNDNGFIMFYKSFIQSKDPALFEDIKKLLEGKKKRTEDIISYLFSEEKYKFKQIFTECKELKVPLLLHYSAILYYVSKLCKLKGIDLPKTVSFSGTGSKYISIVFSSEEHLKQFTKKALSVFSGLPSNSEFSIKRSPDPKVITAKGSVVYASKPLKKIEVDIYETENTESNNSGELQINPVPFIYLGFKDIELEKGDKIYNEFEESKPAYENVILNCVDFLNSFFGSPELMKGSQVALNLDDLAKFKSFFLKTTSDFNVLNNGVLRNSFKSALDKKKMTGRVDDSPFLFAFSTSLIQLSKEIASNTLSKKK